MHRKFSITPYLITEMTALPRRYRLVVGKNLCQLEQIMRVRSWRDLSLARLMNLWSQLIRRIRCILIAFLRRPQNLMEDVMLEWDALWDPTFQTTAWILLVALEGETAWTSLWILMLLGCLSLQDQGLAFFLKMDIILSSRKANLMLTSSSDLWISWSPSHRLESAVLEKLTTKLLGWQNQSQAISRIESRWTKIHLLSSSRSMESPERIITSQPKPMKVNHSSRPRKEIVVTFLMQSVASTRTLGSESRAVVSFMSLLTLRTLTLCSGHALHPLSASPIALKINCKKL
jgi:hypothetical protein